MDQIFHSFIVLPFEEIFAKFLLYAIATMLVSLVYPLCLAL